MTFSSTRLAECSDCTNATGKSFKIRNAALHKLSSFHLTNARAARSRTSANLSQSGARSLWQWCSWSASDRRKSEAPVLGAQNSSRRTSPEAADDGDSESFHECDERSLLLPGSDDEDGQPGLPEADFDDVFGEDGDEFHRDWLGRSKDEINFASNPVAGEVFLAPFNHSYFPNNLEEMRKDGGNFGRYRVVAVHEEEVQRYFVAQRFMCVLHPRNPPVHVLLREARIQCSCMTLTFMSTRPRVCWKNM
jgi:hypothetical protein